MMFLDRSDKREILDEIAIDLHLLKDIKRELTGINKTLLEIESHLRAKYTQRRPAKRRPGVLPLNWKPPVS